MSILRRAELLSSDKILASEKANWVAHVKRGDEIKMKNVIQRSEQNNDGRWRRIDL